MKKLLCSLLFILSGLFVADRFGGMMMNWVGEHTNDVLGPKLRYLHDDIHEDLVLIGASRCHHHYLPSILSDSLGMSVYNVGVGGSDNIFSHYIVLCHILQRYTPKVICLEVMPTDYCRQKDPFNVLSFYAPLFGYCEMADSVYRLAGKHWRYQMSHLFRYNAKASSNIIGLVLNRQTDSDNGYIPLPKPNQFPKDPATEETMYDIDSLKIEYMDRFIGLCQDHHIKLVFTVSPKYTFVAPEHYKVLRDIAQKNGIPFLDYHTKGLYLDHPDYFKDGTHLWDEGARLYSSVFASDLKRVLE
jgi:hypothetical protein